MKRLHVMQSRMTCRIIGCALVIFAALISITAPIASAQFLGGDFRNTTLNIGEGMGGDIALNVQTDAQGNQLATGGVTVKQGDEVSFDYRGSLKTATAGFWNGKEGKTFTVLFRDQEGNKFAIIALKGEVRWNTDRNVSTGKDNFLKITTKTASDKELKIVQRELVDGKLQITAEDGVKYIIYSLSCDFTGTIEKVEKKGVQSPTIEQVQPPTIEQVQQRLKELGYNPGPVDGKIGKKTENAIRQFQQDHDLSVTGELDEETENKLGL